MMANKRRCLLDTSIQIKRLVSRKWLEAGHDRLWKEVEPVSSVYSLMEFKNSVIGALCYLIDVLNEIRLEKRARGHGVQTRLEEVVMALNMDTALREKDRRVRLASAYAAQILSETRSYTEPRTVDEVIAQLQLEARNLERIGFSFYAIDGNPISMALIDRVKCELGKSESPLDVGRLKYTCRKSERACCVAEFIADQQIARILMAIAQGDVTIHDERLKKGALKVRKATETGDIQMSRSIGQGLCPAIGDCIIVGKALLEGLELCTVDKDQEALAGFANVSVIVYDPRANVLR